MVTKSRCAASRVLTGEGLSKDTQRRWGGVGKGQAMWFWKGKRPAGPGNKWPAGNLKVSYRAVQGTRRCPLLTPSLTAWHALTSLFAKICRAPPADHRSHSPPMQWNSWMPNPESVASSDFPTSESQNHTSPSLACATGHTLTSLESGYVLQSMSCLNGRT